MADAQKHFSQAEAQIRTEITSALKQALAKNFDRALVEINYPPDDKLGDYSLPCFSFAQALKKSPAEVASQLAKSIQPSGLISRVIAVGPYLNFFVDQSAFTKLVLDQISKDKEKYGRGTLGKGKRVMIEYFGPNTNKPLTVGHLRNICLGYSITELMKFLGYKVMPVTLYNDRGIALAKTIVAYQKWAKGATPKSSGMKPDHFVGSWYVRFTQEAQKQPQLEREAQQVLRVWERGDKTVRGIWEKLVGWALAGYEQTLKKLKIPNFEEKYYESEYYNRAKEVIEEGLRRGIFKQHPDGYVYAELEPYGLPNKILLRSDGTTLYLTQDIYLASLKNRHRLDQSIIVAAHEQDNHFRQLFKILELLDAKQAAVNYHLSYGMVRLPSGRIKSREGLVEGTGADELLGQLEAMATVEVKQRDTKLSAQEINRRAEQIALAALKFYILLVDPGKTMIFEPKKSLAFTGRTGPYVQYVITRINSIFAKVKQKPSARVNAALLVEPAEFFVIKLLARFPAILARVAAEHNPSVLTQYLYDVAKAFSLLYETVPVAEAETKLRQARLALLADVRIVLVQGLKLLGISSPEKM